MSGQIDPWKRASIAVGQNVLCTIASARRQDRYRLIIAKNNWFGDLITSRTDLVIGDTLIDNITLIEHETGSIVLQELNSSDNGRG